MKDKMNQVEKVQISVLIPAKNEEHNIRACLESVQWADEIFVVDSMSTDNTAKIVQEFGAQLYQFHYDGRWPKKKNWALRNLPFRNEWILILDADERVTARLKKEIAEAVSRSDYNGYYIRWKFVFLGRWMKHSWSNAWMLRLLRHGKGEYEDLGMRDEGGWDNEVHENLIVQGKTSCLHNYLLHETNNKLSYWIKKQNEFSDWNSIRRLRQLQEGVPPVSYFFSNDALKKRKFLKSLYIRLPGRPLLMFIYLYLFKLGFLDGKEGFYFCALRAMHELNIDAKIFELRKGGEDLSQKGIG